MKKRVLFLCTGNSCRSQMAEGLLRHADGEHFEVESAGTHPAGVNPLAIEVMAEAGMDISAHRSKSVTEMEGRTFDYVITVCDHARASCPVFPGSARKLHWNIPDPGSATGSRDQLLPVFRSIRDLLADHIKRLTTPKDEDDAQDANDRTEDGI